MHSKKVKLIFLLNLFEIFTFHSEKKILKIPSIELQIVATINVYYYFFFKFSNFSSIFIMTLKYE